MTRNTPAVPTPRWWLAVAALSCLLALVVVARLLPAIGRSIYGYPDALLNLSLLRWGVDSRWAEYGFWSPPFFHPVPGARAFSDHLAGLVPVFGALASLGGDALAYNSMVVASFPLAALGAFALLARVGLRPAVGLVVALAYAFVPYRILQLQHLQLLWMPGIPLVLVAADRLLESPGGRRLAGFLAAYLLAVSAGSYLAYLVHVPLLALLVVHMAAWRGRRPGLRELGVLVTAGAGAASLAAPFFLPYLRMQLDYGLARHPAAFFRLGATPTRWVTPGELNVYAALWPRAWVERSQALFPGLLLALLLVAGALSLLGRGRPPLSRFERGLLLGGALSVALAHGSVWRLAARWIPGFDAMRVPNRMVLLVFVAALPLAARGLEWIRERLPARRRDWLLVGAGLLLLLPECWPVRFPGGRVRRIDRPGAARGYVEWLRDAPGVGAVAVLPFDPPYEAVRMQSATVHRRPIVNGYSGFDPPQWLELRTLCTPRRGRFGRACIDALAARGVTHLVLDFERGRQPEAQSPRRRWRACLTPAARARVVPAFADPRSVGGILRPEGSSPASLSRARRW